MLHKRSRAAFEADLQAQQSPYVAFGTPLPAIDPKVRDDGSYVPVWKQEVTDDQGRKRLHGAFTGGFSAGYYNTVGSKEGWTPSTFVSSKSNRSKNAQSQQRPEDFMDQEDLAEAEEAKKLDTDAAYSGLGSTKVDAARRATVMDIFRTTGETIGTRLLRKMGWRDGQGIGPKVRRKARLAEDEGPDPGRAEETYLFAPEDSHMISFVRKDNLKGLGFEGEERLANEATSHTDELRGEEIYTPSTTKLQAKAPRKKGGFGIGVLNDTGSDEEDPYEEGPQIAYKRTLGNEKKKKKKNLENGLRSIGSANPLLKNKPVFLSKRGSSNNTSSSQRRCHDGRLSIHGFVLSSSAMEQQARYTPPTMPGDWVSKMSSSTSKDSAEARNQPTASIARESTHNPASRASLLGEAPLPGKSVFSFMTPGTRDRIASLTKNESLPAAGSEIPESVPDESLIPSLDPAVAAAALGRGSVGFVPYADNPSKLARYRAFLSYSANLSSDVPSKPATMGRDDWRTELDEFAHAATIFKPMSGRMASRFTSGSGGTPSSTENGGGQDEKGTLLRKPSERKSDPAEEAARLGMFGPMTRSMRPFYPNRLLCKRFDLPAPAWTGESAAAAGGQEQASQTSATPTNASDFASRFSSGGVQPGSGANALKTKELLGKDEMEALRREAGVEVKAETGPSMETAQVKVDPERNEALEADRPGDAVFKAIFGSDSEDD